MGNDKDRTSKRTMSIEERISRRCEKIPSVGHRNEKGQLVIPSDEHTDD